MADIADTVVISSIALYQNDVDPRSAIVQNRTDGSVYSTVDGYRCQGFISFVLEGNANNRPSVQTSDL